ncbi:MAG: biliverdin-producing heme oxygenase, partial [Bacteroidota bacterium]|nr:biliverdin-producing heme oxygenase [Bacteroidota bacterium]MDX5431888.1 biliverdin-producing heme oxygenase [Bacteroidota bacterium]MDX5470602.1 biliverdin-producing heme oxygenase [Bacteroidota bacterium]
MITERLKTETRPQHDAMERVGFSDKIMSGRLSLEEYKLLIRNNYIMNQIMERGVESVEGFTSIPGLNYESRKKGALLEKDLQVLGLNQAEIDQHNYAFQFNSLHEALGAFYVMEGSTLGGSVISRQLAKTESLQSVPEFNFYGCYGDMVGPNWKAFQGVLIEQAN